jgi:hypothetical protein
MSLHNCTVLLSERMSGFSLGKMARRHPGPESLRAKRDTRDWTEKLAGTSMQKRSSLRDRPRSNARLVLAVLGRVLMTFGRTAGT